MILTLQIFPDCFGDGMLLIAPQQSDPAGSLITVATHSTGKGEAEPKTMKPYLYWYDRRFGHTMRLVTA